jgi:pimeloyl-ACP methyl ester carboxylesterase
MTSTSPLAGGRSQVTEGKSKPTRTDYVASTDGTRIAFERHGAGPPLILVDGAMCSRSFGPMPKLVPLLARRFDVISFDRRGRGESGDRAPYAIEREVEDLAALVTAAGGGASIFGISSGAALAIRAAASGLAVRKLVLYEPPFVVPGAPPPLPPDRQAEIEQMVADGRRGDAVKAFMRMVGVPGIFLPIMRIMPGVWSKLTAAANTLPHDFAALGHSAAGKPLPADISQAMAAIKVPTLVGVGSKSPPWMQHAVQSVAGAIAGAEMRVLDGQTHNLSAKAADEMIARFLGDVGP